MLALSIYLCISILISSILLLIPLFISTTTNNWTENESQFECGISINYTPRTPFSLRFFLLMVLFIIFDIEIVLVLALPILTCWPNNTILFFIIFTSILTTGVLYEWTEGSLNWTF